MVIAFKFAFAFKIDGRAPKHHGNEKWRNKCMGLKHKEHKGENQEVCETTDIGNEPKDAKAIVKSIPDKRNQWW